MTTTKGPKRLKAEWDSHAKAWAAKAAREAGYDPRCVECQRARTLDNAGLCHECWQAAREAGS